MLSVHVSSNARDLHSRRRMARGGHGPPKVSPGSACRHALPFCALRVGHPRNSRFRVGPPRRAGCLQPSFTPLDIPRHTLMCTVTRNVFIWRLTFFSRSCPSTFSNATPCKQASLVLLVEPTENGNQQGGYRLIISILTPNAQHSPQPHCGPHLSNAGRPASWRMTSATVTWSFPLAANSGQWRATGSSYLSSPWSASEATAMAVRVLVALKMLTSESAEKLDVSERTC
jgi:hypothetical protein